MTTTPTTLVFRLADVPRPRHSFRLGSRAAKVLWAVAFALWVAGCSRPQSPPQPAWLPDDAGWTLRDFDDAEPALWVLYERDAKEADVKEFRLVGVVDAAPDVVAAALRFRLLDEQYVAKGLDRRILVESEEEVIVYGRTSLPFPFRDREATERYVFTHDLESQVFRVVARAIDPGGEPPRGVVRVPVIRNAWVAAPSGAGPTVFTTDTVHDIGGAFPNALIYAPICDQLVEDLYTVRKLAAQSADAAG